MRFGPVPIDEAAGDVLGHNVSDASGRRVLRKGRFLTTEDIALLRTLGRSSVYVARLEAGDIDENVAASRLAEAAAGAGTRRTPAVTGRVNLHATDLGVLRIQVDRLGAFNAVPGVALATLPMHTAVAGDRMVATLKVIPFALPGDLVSKLELTARSDGPVLRVDPIPRGRVGIILSGSTAARERVTESYLAALRPRLEALGAAIDRVDYIPLDDEADELRLAEALQRGIEDALELIILAGETAIQDRLDIAPRAIERIGGVVTCYGAPVDPGNLLLLARHGATAILGAPGCARSRKTNIVDLVLPRLLVGERLDSTAVAGLGLGGLLDDISERPSPRSSVAGED